MSNTFLFDWTTSKLHSSKTQITWTLRAPSKVQSVIEYLHSEFAYNDSPCKISKYLRNSSERLRNHLNRIFFKQYARMFEEKNRKQIFWNITIIGNQSMWYWIWAKELCFRLKYFVSISYIKTMNCSSERMLRIRSFYIYKYLCWRRKLINYGCFVCEADWVAPQPIQPVPSPDNSVADYPSSHRKEIPNVPSTAGKVLENRRLSLEDNTTKKMKREGKSKNIMHIATWNIIYQNTKNYGTGETPNWCTPSTGDRRKMKKSVSHNIYIFFVFEHSLEGNISTQEHRECNRWRTGYQRYNITGNWKRHTTYYPWISPI